MVKYTPDIITKHHLLNNDVSQISLYHNIITGIIFIDCGRSYAERYVTLLLTVTFQAWKTGNKTRHDM